MLRSNVRQVTSFFQISTNIQVEYNPDNNNGSKLVSVTVGGEPIDNSTDYNVVTLDYLAGGGDNFFTPTTDFITLDTQDQVLNQYILQESPVDIELDGRIAQVDRQRSDDAGGSDSSSGESDESDSSTGGGNGTELEPEQQTENDAPRVQGWGNAGLCVLVFALWCGL